MNNDPKRTLVDILKEWMFNEKALIVTGARQVGKTTMLQNMFSDEEVLWLNADLTSVRARLENADIVPLQSLVGNYRIVVIDEIQRVKNPGLLLKIMVDHFKGTRFIATGSSALDISEQIYEPLTGRHFLFHLYPFALSELYAKKSIFEVEQQLPFHLVFGNYPDISMHRNKAEKLLNDLSRQYLYKDVLVWKDIRKPQLLDKLLKLLAYQVSSEVSNNELANQLQIKSETVETYIDLLEKSFVIFRLNSYSTNERKEVSKMSKIYFFDNGIRNAIIGNYDPIENRQDIGALWENFMVSERMKLNSWNHENRKPYFWRNYNKSEVDYVELENNQLSAFEMKWNTKKKNRVTKAFTNSYPNAVTEVITPQNFADFVGLT